MDSTDAKYLTEALQDIASVIREANRPRFITLHFTDGSEGRFLTSLVSPYYGKEGGGSYINTRGDEYIVTETTDEITRLIEEAYR